MLENDNKQGELLSISDYGLEQTPEEQKEFDVGENQRNRLRFVPQLIRFGSFNDLEETKFIKEINKRDKDHHDVTAVSQE